MVMIETPLQDVTFKLYWGTRFHNNNNTPGTSYHNFHLLSLETSTSCTVVVILLSTDNPLSKF
jgi:hypothetical protein